MFTRRHSRPGISTVIGAVFFVLVVFLVFSSTVLVFQAFSGYANQFKQVNAQDVQNKDTSVTLQNLVFGGVIPPASGVMAINPTVANSVNKPLLPVTNMNLSSSMTGWTFSKEYKIVRDDGLITNTFQDVLPSVTVFTLGISNTDPGPPAPASTIIQVSLQVDSRFTLAGTQIPPNGNWVVGIVGNAITWTATPPAAGIPNTGANSLNFTWTAIAPSVPNTYFQTVTLTWATTFHLVPIVDSGTAPVTTTVVTSGPGGSSVSQIVAQPPSAVPGGVTGGYDPISTGIGSESGPGSMYLDFQPTYNGTVLTNNQQLTAQMNYTTAFNIDPTTAAVISSGACCSLSYGYSLDQLRAPPSPLVITNVYLAKLTAAYTVGQILTLDTAVPSQVNGGNSTGWIMRTATTNPALNFSPPAGFWTVGCPLQGCNYELIVSITASMPATNPPSNQYPSTMMMHFDDIGLALGESGTSYYADNGVSPIQIPACVIVTAGQPCGSGGNPPPVDPSQVQSIHLAADLAQAPGSTGEVTAYVFIGDVSRESVPPTQPVWVEVGQVNFVSSVTFNAVIPASSSSVYIDQRAPPGQQCSNVCVRVYAIWPNPIGVGPPPVISANVSLTLQTWQQSSGVIRLTNNGTSTVHVVSALISGPTGIYVYDQSQLDLGYVNPVVGALGYWVNPGQTLQIPLPQTNAPANDQFNWLTDQSYEVTVVTSQGLIISGTYVSP